MEFERTERLYVRLIPNQLNLQHTPEIRGLQGLSNVMELMVQKYMNANDGDETYVRVPASKEFYVFTTSVIEPDRASVGAYEQDSKAQTLWEQIKAAKATSEQNGMRPWVRSGFGASRSRCRSDCACCS